MLVDTLKKEIIAAMKAKRAVEKDIYKLALSEIQAEAARSGGEPDDAMADRLIRKLIKSNRETLDNAREDMRVRLEQEIEALERLLPQQWGEAEIEAALASVVDAIKSAKADGQATGVAMKHLKASGAPVDGKLVGQVVKRLRAS